MNEFTKEELEEFLNWGDIYYYDCMTSAYSSTYRKLKYIVENYYDIQKNEFEQKIYELGLG